ncbi:MAG: glycosyltransferase family 4 protein [Thermomicrobiales bacterium]
MNRPKVTYWNNIPSPYVVGRFNAVAARGNVDLDAWFSVDKLAINAWDVAPADWAFRAEYVPAPRSTRNRLQLPLDRLRETRCDVFVSLFSEPSFVAGHLAARRHAGRTAFRVLPTFDAWVPRSPQREAMKQVLFRSVDAAKVSGPAGASQAGRYGLPPDRTFEVTQSIDVELYSQALAMGPDERHQRRQELGLHGFVFIYVGRLWQKKGLDDLFDAFELVQQKVPDCSLLIVGTGVDEDRYRERSQGNASVIYTGFVQAREIPQIYALADAFVFPTLGDPNGLVVEEAMVSGLPVVSTTAAGDIARRLDDGTMGYLVPPTCPAQLADRMVRLAADPAGARSMGAHGRERAIGKSHEQYAIDFEHFIESVLKLPPRRGPIPLLTGTAGRFVPTQASTPARDTAHPTGNITDT